MISPEKGSKLLYYSAQRKGRGEEGLATFPKSWEKDRGSILCRGNAQSLRRFSEEGKKGGKGKETVPSEYNAV